LQLERTSSVIVILPGSATNHPSLFRQIEHIADLLAELLASSRRVAGMYELVGGRFGGVDLLVAYYLAQAVGD